MVDPNSGHAPKTNSKDLFQEKRVGSHAKFATHFPSDPIDCVTLRRSSGCMLSINAIDVPELVFRLEGETIMAVSQGRAMALKMPSREIEAEVLRMLRADPKSVYLVEIDACGDVVLTHDIGMSS